jgi:hypothetical protein
MLRARWGRAAAAVAAMCAASAPCAAARAQLPGVPVLQNAFTNPGLTTAANFGWGGGNSAYALAAAWAPGSARFQLSGGLGAYSPDVGKRMFAYGARASVPLLGFFGRGGGAFDIAGFAGVGRASVDSVSATNIPVGVGAGYRRTIGESRGVSAYVAPFMLFASTSGTGGGDSNDQLVRTSLGLDFSFTPKIGVTLGAELGKNAESGKPGPTSSVFGVGLSYAFR